MAVFCILRAVGTDAGLGNIAIAVQIAARNPKADAFADRQIDHAVHIEPVIVAITAGQRAFEPVSRLVGREDDCAAGRVLAEQGSLRTLQDLHRLQVIGRVGDREVRGDRNIVKVDCDTALRARDT